MNRTISQLTFFLSTLFVLAVFFMGANLAIAQESEPLAPSAPEDTVGTAFTYQGKLTDNGTPANGDYDFQFGLYDAEAGGSQFGTLVTMEDVTVTDGLFTVLLNFGEVFDGTALWLAIGVRPGAETGAYTSLSPRQALTASPYAVNADYLDGQHANAFASASHNHLGETWIGTNNPLTISGSFASPNAPLVLSNSDPAGDGLRVDSANDDGIHVISVGDDGVYVGSAGGDGMKVNSAGDAGLQVNNALDGVRIISASGEGVQVDSASYDGVYVGSAGDDGIDINGAASNGIEISNVQDGVHVVSATDDGVHVNSADDDGVYVASANDVGVYVQSAGGDGVVVASAGTPSMTNSSGALNGFEVAGAGGSGLYVGRADAFGVHVESAGVDGVVVGSAGRYGVYVYSADQEGVVVNSDGVGVAVTSAGLSGVFANTEQADHEWGFTTPDAIYAGSSVASGGPLLFVAQNGGESDLETGDIVAISGMGTPFGESAVPTPLVERADAGGRAPVFGVVYNSFVLSEETEEIELDGQVEQHTSLHANSAAGPTTPGEHLLVVVMGVAQVKVESLSGEVYPGALLAVEEDGRIAIAGSDTAFGSLVGTIMEARDAAKDGLIWMLVNPH